MSAGRVAVEGQYTEVLTVGGSVCSIGESGSTEGLATDAPGSSTDALLNTRELPPVDAFLVEDIGGAKKFCSLGGTGTYFSLETLSAVVVAAVAFVEALRRWLRSLLSSKYRAYPSGVLHCFSLNLLILILLSFLLNLTLASVKAALDFLFLWVAFFLPAFCCL